MQATTIFSVNVQGFGDSEDQFYCMGNYTSRDLAALAVEQILLDWVADGGDRSEVVYDITEGRLI